MSAEAWQTDPLESILARARDQHSQARLDEAAALYQQILDASDVSDHAATASAFNGLALIRISQGRYAEATKLASEAASMRHRLGDRLGEAGSTSNIGLAHYYLGNFRQAVEYYEAAYELDVQNDDLEGQVIDLNNVANVFLLQGQYTSALDRYKLAILNVDEAGDAGWAAHERFRTSVNLATLYQKLGLSDEALNLYRSIGDLSAVATAEEHAQVETNLGVLYRHLGDPIKALESYEKALERFRQAGSLDGEVQVLKNIGIALALDLHDLEMALANFERALELSRNSGNARETMQTQLYVAEALRQLEREKEAQNAFQFVFDRANELDTAEEKWRSLYGLARIAADAGDSTTAKSLLADAVSEIESLKARLSPGGLSRGFLADKQAVFNAFIALLVRELDPQSGESQLDPLLRLLQSHQTDLFERQFSDILKNQISSVAEPRRRHLNDLRKQLTELWSQELREGSEVDLTARIDEVAGKYLDAERALLADVNLTRPEQLSRSILMSRIPPGTTVVILWEGADLWAALFLTNRTANWGRGTLSDGLRSDIEACAEAVRTLHSEWRTACSQVSAIFSNSLLRHLPSDQQRILIVTDGVFRQLPFEVLTDEGGLNLLVERYSISYLPSLQQLGLQIRPPHRRWLPWDLSLVGLADPEVATDTLDAPLDRLPHSVDEIDRARNHLSGGAHLLTGANATKAGLVSALAGSPSVLHLATHARADVEDPQRSRILLTEGNNGKADYLFLTEVLGLPTKGVDLVVLSACETAGRTASKYGGVESFSRAFLLTGSRAVIATLWGVDDAATAQFMDGFYAYASTGVGKGEALRKAKLRLLRSGTSLAHPFYWSGFVLFGDGRGAIPLPIRWSSVGIGVGGLFILLAIAFLSRRRKGSLSGRPKDPRWSGR